MSSYPPICGIGCKDNEKSAKSFIGNAGRLNYNLDPPHHFVSIKQFTYFAEITGSPPVCGPAGSFKIKNFVLLPGNRLEVQAWK